MRGIIISLLAGVALAIGVPTVAALMLSHGNPEAVIPFLLYWPTSVTDKLGFGDCANANLIADKLNCMRMAIIIDAICYPLVIIISSYIIHLILFRRGWRLRPAPVE
jgi:hypothetical protein